MASNQADSSLPDDFANIVRLFPLPNLVLFPGVVQALHIFEPRYIELLNDALSDDNLITMALLKSGGSPETSYGPEISSTVCVGKIISHTELPDGRFNLFLVGTKRARIVEEFDSEMSYRMAKVQIVEDVTGANVDHTILRHQIITEFRKLASLHSEWNHEALDPFLDEDLPIGQLIDMIGYACGIDPTEQQRILETPDVGQRGKLLLSLLKQTVIAKNEQSGDRTFPPDFSLN